jgi:putative ABC transport system permease protein
LIRRVLERILGRLPIGWLQLAHNKTRLMAAIAGVMFANVLVFMQLGFFGALVGSIKLPYASMNAELMIAASDMNSLGDGGAIPRARMYQALGVDGVASATPVFHGKISWKQADGTERNLDVFGIDPMASPFNNEEICAKQKDLMVIDNVILDRKTLNVPKDVYTKVDGGEAHRFESRGRTLSVVGTFTIGGGFGADGYMIASDQTFLRLFPQRTSGAPSFILVKLKPEADHVATLAKLRAVLPDFDVVVRTLPETTARDQNFQTTQKPVGLIFGFGTVIGVLVGLIIVYQVLTTDVADHLKEYATFKAIGYKHSFFVSIILEEAMILALFGFVPALGAGLGLYAMVAKATGLPIAMTMERAIGVLIGTFVSCAISGVLAARKLAKANPAELF